MNAMDIRKKFIEYFTCHEHCRIPGSSLIPENDPSVLFTTAGMYPLVPFLMGELHPQGKRLVNYQKCLRTDDIDEVGDDIHLTFFEMLGNWPLGDYFKDDAISMSYDFIVNWLKLDHDRLVVSVFSGDEDAPKDMEAAKVWKTLGIREENIFYYGKKHNWWGPAELAKENNVEADINGFEELYKKHQELSRKGASQKFKGGLVDNTIETSALHTATHLLHKALQLVLGEHVKQKGSNITKERLRFDFSHNKKMTPDEIREVESIVNKVISEKLPVICQEITVSEAKETSAEGLFTDKYTDVVKVYSIGSFSKEICGGPHAPNTSNLGHFKIVKEQSVAAGVRRIKAILQKLIFTI